jgi:hypothetical protein|tara:strand:+ start:7689 stop:7919 length:231 start_codon:yes stop_codon:yes gene_type:complete
MTATKTETLSKEELLDQFKTRYGKLVEENKELSEKIRSNEQTALKLLGAIETLEYLSPEKLAATTEVTEDINNSDE